MKILYVITSLDYGGTQKQLYHIITNFKKSTDILIVLVSLKVGGRVKDKFLSLRVPVYVLGLPQNWSLFLLPILLYSIVKFLFIVFRFKPDIIHSFLFQANLLSKFIRLFSPSTKLICSERVAEREKKWQILVSKMTNFLAKKIVVNSEDLKRFVMLTQNCPDDKIVVIPNIVDFRDVMIKKHPLDIRKELGAKSGTFLILSVGRLHRQKGYDLLIEVAREVVDKIKDVMFVIIGDGEEMEKLIKVVTIYRLEDTVKFIGYRENVYDYINACNLFLLTSYWEGSPNVILEAMQLNKPIISTEVCGVKELIDGVNGCYIIPLYGQRQKIVSEIIDKILILYDMSKRSTLKLDYQFRRHYAENVISELISLYTTI